MVLVVGGGERERVFIRQTVSRGMGFNRSRRRHAQPLTPLKIPTTPLVLDGPSRSFASLHYSFITGGAFYNLWSCSFTQLSFRVWGGFMMFVVSCCWDFVMFLFFFLFLELYFSQFFSKRVGFAEV